MRLWLRYFRENKTELFLCLISVVLFVAVGSLYHLENLDKLFYAAFLVLVIWGVTGLYQGIKYVQKSRQLEETAKQFAGSGVLSVEDWKPEEQMEDAGTYEEAQWLLLSLLDERRERDRQSWEEKFAESKDYYVLWTHQIKTPISAIKLLLAGNESYGREGYLLREELFKIEQYVEMVLTFQRLESMASDLSLQKYDLYSLVKQAVKKYSVLFINKGLSLELKEMQLEILTDEKWFIFCLEQILSNSIKYTREGGIVISAWVESGENGVSWGSLCIQDSGIGIHPEDLPRIFDRGFTGYNGRVEKRSTGIGLYLCRQIFFHLGIRVQVESDEGKGTRVTLRWNQEHSFLHAD